MNAVPSFAVVTILPQNATVEQVPRKAPQTGFNYRQIAYVPEAGSAFPRKIVFTLPDDRNGAAYPAGQYLIGASSMAVNKWGRLELAFSLSLEPLPKELQAQLPKAAGAN